MTDDRVPDPQRPVWKEQWCPRRDSLGSSDGKEYQFWITGASEPFPTPSLSNHSCSPYLADYGRSRRAQPYPPPAILPALTSTARKDRLPMDCAAFLPTSFRRDCNSNWLHSRKESPLSIGISTMQHIYNSDLTQLTHSAEPYPSESPALYGQRLHERSVREEKSFSTGEWGQSKPTFGLSANRQYDLEQPADALMLFSTGRSQMPLMAPSYGMHNHASSSMRPSDFYLSSPATSEQRQSSMPLHTTELTVSSSSSDISSHSAMYVKESELHGSFSDVGDTLYMDFWSHVTSARQDGDESLSWLNGLPSQLIFPSTTATHPAPPFSSPATYDSMAPPADAQGSGFATHVQPSFELNNDLYDSRNASHAAQQPAGLDFPHTLPNIE